MILMERLAGILDLDNMNLLQSHRSERNTNSLRSAISDLAYEPGSKIREYYNRNTVGTNYQLLDG